MTPTRLLLLQMEGVAIEVRYDPALKPDHRIHAIVTDGTECSEGVATINLPQLVNAKVFAATGEGAFRLQESETIAFANLLQSLGFLLGKLQERLGGAG